MEFTTILFDLDGTLTDPFEGITNSVAYALKKMGITPPKNSELKKFIGPPLAESFEKFYGLSKEESYKAVDIYREYFAPKGIFENTIFKGIPEMLASLKKAEKRLALATSKPTVFAKKILKHFNIDKYFDVVVGSNLDGSMTDKAEVVAAALKGLGAVEPSATVMVGDRSHDIIGGIKNGICTVGVTFGYGTKEELEQFHADYIAGSVDELKNILLG
ncbi:MAG: HAD family hydrolase [Clostridia bacterium]|nr:HAD family hydrolase [Clostridia bacterium]